MSYFIELQKDARSGLLVVILVVAGAWMKVIHRHIAHLTLSQLSSSRGARNSVLSTCRLTATTASFAVF